MKSGKSDWQEMTKRGLFPELAFTDEMKNRVLGRIIAKQRSSGSRTNRLVPNLLAAALSVVLVTALIGIQSESEAWRRADKFAHRGGASISVELPVTYAVLDARTLQKGETIFDADPNVLPGLSNKHSPLINHSVDEVISLNDIDLLNAKRVDGFGTLFQYRLRGQKDSSASDHSTSYFGFSIDRVSDPDTIYHVGYGHMYEQARHAMTRIFDQEALKVEQSQCRVDGEACVWYFTVDRNVPVLYAMFEAQSYERDLDGDGVEEIIIATKKRNQIYIMKEANGQLLWASVRDITHSGPDDELVYNEGDGTFLLTASESGSKSTYAYSSNGDQLVLIDN